LNINEFVEERKGEWKRLEEIANKISSSRKAKISKEDLWDFPRLYSAAVADLSIIRSASRRSRAAEDILDYLNKLVLRAHGVIYKRPPFHWSMVWRFFSVRFGSAVRREWPYLAISIGIFTFFALAGFALSMNEPEFIPLLVSDQIIDKVERGQVWFKDLYGIAPAASAGLMSHNISVTFLVIASGITFGLGVIYLMGLNGLLIGTVAALCLQNDLSLELWSFVLPHGAFELTAIFLAGAAGLIIGHGLADPGPHRRSQILKYCGARAGDLILGLIPMLIIAGFIEAYFSPSPLPELVRLGVGFALIGLIILYFTLAGASGNQAEPEDLTGPAPGMGKLWEEESAGIRINEKPTASRAVSSL
jgi:uncharacterized membrane protein SpoIIM required for sporulation